jgi:hypothetical protein
MKAWKSRPGAEIAVVTTLYAIDGPSWTLIRCTVIYNEYGHKDMQRLKVSVLKAEFMKSTPSKHQIR